MSDYYGQQIYNLLNTYLPKLSAALQSIDTVLQDVRSFVVDYKGLIMIVIVLLLYDRFCKRGGFNV